MKKTILFLCTHNSARSQIAEGLINQFFSNNYVAFSAGTEPGEVNPYATVVMKEIGVDISSHHSKSVKDFSDKKFDYVITVCDKAKENCPIFTNTEKLVHKSFEDPSTFNGTSEEKLNRFKNVRDEITGWLENKFN